MFTRLFGNRRFLFLWLALVLSTMANQLYAIGVMVVVFERTGSALQTAGVLVARTAPAFLLGPVAGVLVDRFSRQRVLVVIDALRAVLVVLLILFVAPGQVQIWGVYAVLFALAAAATFYKPAQLALIPAVAPKDDLVQANSLIMSTNQATLAAAYVAGGALILWLGFSRLVWLNLAFFVLAALAAAFISPHPGAEGRARGYQISPWRALLAGLSYLREHPLARPLVLMETFEYFPHAIWTSALMLVFTTQALSSDAQAWGYQVGAFYGGQLVGALLAVVLAARLARYPGWAIITNAFLFSILTLGYALSPNVPWAVALCFVFGPPSALRDVSQDALLQAAVEPGMLGRVYATRDMLTNLVFMLAGIGFAWLADHTPVRGVYLVGGIMYLGTAFYALGSQAIRRSRVPGEGRA